MDTEYPAHPLYEYYDMSLKYGAKYILYMVMYLEKMCLKSSVDAVFKSEHGSVNIFCIKWMESAPFFSLFFRPFYNQTFQLAIVHFQSSHCINFFWPIFEKINLLS